MADDEDVFGNPLGTEDDDHDAVHGPDLTRVLAVATLDEARERARFLVEHGVGATVAPGAVPPAGGPPGFEVRVLPEDVVRATDLLEGRSPEGPVSGEPAGAGDDPAPPRAKAPVPWRTLLAIWVAAMILFPLVAGYVTYLVTR